MFLQRILNLPDQLEKKSFFLFGPRATGKSSLIRESFCALSPAPCIIDLLQSELYFRLSTAPEQLASIIMAYPNHAIVIIDEIQRIPILLNEVHRLIESYDMHFLLTGSSARKLRHGAANLLAGRARQAEIFPLTYTEIPSFDLIHYLTYGGLPIVHLSSEPLEDLHAYVDTYLKEEIQAEAVVRKLSGFTRFLQFSALTSGQMLNFAHIANDAGVPASTVREYYHILEDTFIGFYVPAWKKSVKRKAIRTTKFYFFDIGVKNILAGIKVLEPMSDLYGQAFEHFIALELRAYISYRRKHWTLSYWQSKNGQEVDFILEDEIAIEVKTTAHVQNKHLKGLKALAEENICKHYFLISHDLIPRKVDNMEILHWQVFLDRLWGDALA